MGKGKDQAAKATAYSGIGGGIGGAIGGGIGLLLAGDGGEDEYRKAVKVLQDLEESNFDFSQFSPPEIQLFAQYFPEQYDAVAPPEVRQIVESPEGRQGQLETMGFMKGIRDEGLPVASRIATGRATRALAGQLESSQANAMRNFASRGRLGSGEELAARMGGDQASMGLARDLGDTLVSNELQQRMAAGLNYGNLSGTMRGQDFETARANADITNRANQWLSEIRTNAAAANAGARERAQFGNVATAQHVGETNAMNKYNVALQNLTRKNDLLGQLFGQRLAKARALSDAYSAWGAQKDRQRAAEIGLGEGIGSGIGSAAGGLFAL